MSYFRGCSSGGRAALVNAERFPGDFDGIIAGDAGNPRAGAYFLPVWIMQSNTGTDGKSILTQADLPKITTAVVAACGAGEGKRHGFLDDPLSCKFDPISIVCKTAEVKPDCITRQQAEFVRKVYDGPRDSKGRPVYLGGVRIFGLTRGSETLWTSWIAKDSNPTSAPEYAGRLTWFQEQAFMQAGTDHNFKLTDVDFDRDPDRANAIESLWSSSNPDLRALQDKGVKILSYSGWSDNPGAARGYRGLLPDIGGNYWWYGESLGVLSIVHDSGYGTLQRRPRARHDRLGLSDHGLGGTWQGA